MHIVCNLRKLCIIWNCVARAYYFVFSVVLANSSSSWRDDSQRGLQFSGRPWHSDQENILPPCCLHVQQVPDHVVWSVGFTKARHHARSQRQAVPRHLRNGRYFSLLVLLQNCLLFFVLFFLPLQVLHLFAVDKALDDLKPPMSANKVAEHLLPWLNDLRLSQNAIDTILSLPPRNKMLENARSV